MLSEIKSLRFGYSQDARPLYERLVSASSDAPQNSPFKTQKDLFVAAACLGSMLGEMDDRTKPIRNIPGSVLDDRTDVPVLLALAYKHGGRDLSLVFDARKVMEISESLAEAGVSYLSETVRSGDGMNPLERIVNMLLVARAQAQAD